MVIRSFLRLQPSLDETGFAMDSVQPLKASTVVEHSERRRGSDSGNCDLITIVERMSSTKISIPPVAILKLELKPQVDSL
jgi:hypothetical protein